jgi:octaprenyl-diphosphate synthase
MKGRYRPENDDDSNEESDEVDGIFEEIIPCRVYLQLSGTPSEKPANSEADYPPDKEGDCQHNEGKDDLFPKLIHLGHKPENSKLFTLLLWSMSLTLDDIKAPVAREMEEFEQKFRASMKTKVLLLDKIMSYIVKRKGKQMRPLFVFLSAGSCGGITESTYRAASLIELLHTASLVHDDVVDEANYRRGFFSVNALWKNKIAVLVGDFLLTRGLSLSLDNREYDLLNLANEAVREMSEGELLQMEKARRLDVDEEVYYEIIRQKTASLLASCCAVGASSAGASPDMVGKMKKLGECVGMAFQIKDDLFDYGEDEIGKPLGIDIKEKKMTLPLIYALSKSSWLEKRRITNIVRNEGEKPGKVKEVIDYVKARGGIEYAQQAMQRYFQQSMQMIQDLPESPYRTSLGQLVQFTIERKS